MDYLDWTASFRQRPIILVKSHRSDKKNDFIPTFRVVWDDPDKTEENIPWQKALEKAPEKLREYLLTLTDRKRLTIVKKIPQLASLLYDE